MALEIKYACGWYKPLWQKKYKEKVNVGYVINLLLTYVTTD